LILIIFKPGNLFSVLIIDNEGNVSRCSTSGKQYCENFGCASKCLHYDHINISYLRRVDKLKRILK